MDAIFSHRTFLLHFSNRLIRLVLNYCTISESCRASPWRWTPAGCVTYYSYSYFRKILHMHPRAHNGDVNSRVSDMCPVNDSSRFFYDGEVSSTTPKNHLKCTNVKWIRSISGTKDYVCPEGNIRYVFHYITIGRDGFVTVNAVTYRAWPRLWQKQQPFLAGPPQGAFTNSRSTSAAHDASHTGCSILRAHVRKLLLLLL